MRTLLLALTVPFLCAQEKVDLAAINRIKAEALHNSKVMDHAFYLTDVYGPRLAGSPGYKAAAEWAMREMEKWGLGNVKTEKFAFGRGWSNSRFVAAMKEPQYTVLIGAPRPWSPGHEWPRGGRAGDGAGLQRRRYGPVQGQTKRKDRAAAVAGSGDA